MSVKQILVALILLVLMPVALAEEPEVAAQMENYIVIQGECPEDVGLLSVEEGKWEEDWTCYKDQLTGVALAIYEACEAEFSEGTFDYSNGCWWMSNTVEVDSDLDSDELVEEICLGSFAFADDHPEVFWIRKHISYSCRFVGSKAKILVGFKAYPASDTIEERDALQEQIDEVVEEILAGTVGMTTMQKLEYLDNWLAANNAYNYDAARDETWVTRDETPWSVVGALLDGYSPVCEGYAKAFQLLCHEVEIPCLKVSGWADGPHAWNYVKYEGKWYLFDPTNNDCGDTSSQYFFMGEEMNIYQPGDDYILPELPSPDCSSGHEYWGYFVVEPTCTEAGYNIHDCVRCGYTYTDGYVDPLGHSFTEYSEEEGLLVAHCDRDCGQTDEKLGSPSWRMERDELKGAEYATGRVMIALYDQQDRLIAVKFCEKGEEKTLDGVTVFRFTAPKFNEDEIQRAERISCFGFSERYVPLRTVIPIAIERE